MTYVQRQRTAGFKVGDKVKVLRKAKGNEFDWLDTWFDDVMNKMVGNTYKIEYITAFGINLEGWNFPYFVLAYDGALPDEDPIND